MGNLLEIFHPRKLDKPIKLEKFANFLPDAVPEMKILLNDLKQQNRKLVRSEELISEIMSLKLSEEQRDKCVGSVRKT